MLPRARAPGVNGASPTAARLLIEWKGERPRGCEATDGESPGVVR